VKKLNKLTGSKSGNRKVVLAVVFAVVLVGGFFWYKDYSVRADKERFEQAQASIDKLYAGIVAKVGEPNNYDRNQSCGRPNQKFNEGPLSCSVGVDFVYEVLDSSEALILFKKIQNIVSANSSLFQQKNTLSNSFSGSIIGTTVYTAASDQYKELQSGLDCVAKYVYDTPSETFLDLKKTSDRRVFYITIGCSGEASDKYYPVHQ